MRLLSQAGTLLKRPGQAAQNATYAVGHTGPTEPTSLPPGTEFVWFQTDGVGNLLDILSGVAA